MEKAKPVSSPTLTVRFQLTLRQGFCSVIKLLTDSVATVITCLCFAERWSSKAEHVSLQFSV